MSETDSINLVARRRYMKDSLTRMHTKVVIGATEQYSIAMLKTLEERTIDCFFKYEECNMELGELAEDPMSTEACCFDCLAALRTRIAELEEPMKPVTPTAHLRGFLQGEAYDNNFKIIKEHIYAILNMPSCYKNTATGLRSLISNTKQHIVALKNLGEAIESWDSILICILVKKLHPTTSDAYHLALNQTTGQPCLQPTLVQLWQFLEGHALALENNVAGKNVIEPSKVDFTSTADSECSFCGESHKIFSCPSFLLATVEDRIEFTEGKKLCKICLKSHANIKCKFNFKCRKCKERHNTLLHLEKEELNVSSVSNTSALESEESNVGT